MVIMSLTPAQSARVAAWWHGVPEADLMRVCMRESRCSRIGVHDSDASLDGWGGQVRLGHLRPWCQPHGGAPYRWTTRGPWGLSAASHWHYMPACYQPDWFDVPIVSAMVAAAKYRRECAGARRSSWCPRRKQR